MVDVAEASQTCCSCTVHVRDIERAASDEEPFSGLAFKIMTDPYVGKLTYFRVYSGKLEAGSRVLNVTTGRTERIGRILMMHANDREDVTEVYSGDIAAAVGIKQVVTGDTLAMHVAERHPDVADVARTEVAEYAQYEYVVINDENGL